MESLEWASFTHVTQQVSLGGRNELSLTLKPIKLRTPVVRFGVIHRLCQHSLPIPLASGPLRLRCRGKAVCRGARANERGTGSVSRTELKPVSFHSLMRWYVEH